MALRVGAAWFTSLGLRRCHRGDRPRSLAVLCTRASSPCVGGAGVGGVPEQHVPVRCAHGEAGPSVPSASPRPIVFSAAGFLTSFHIGAATRLHAHGRITSCTKMYGASGGALMSAALACDVQLDNMLELQLGILRRCHQDGMFGRLENYIRGSLDDLLPHDAAERCSGRVGIVLTRVWPRISKVTVTDFTDREHLIEALVGSCYVPFWLGGKPVLPYEKDFVVDGGLLRPLPFVPHSAHAGDPIEVHPFTVYPHIRQKQGAISPVLLGKDFGVRLPTLCGWALGFQLKEDDLRYMHSAGKAAADKWSHAQPAA